MSYLDFINKLGSGASGVGSVEELTTGDSGEVSDAMKELFGEKNVSDAEEQKFVPQDVTKWRESGIEKQDFFEDKALLKYPHDLFQPGNTSYIYFQIKKSAPVVGEGAKLVAGILDPQLGSRLANQDPLDPTWGSHAPPLKRIALYMPPAVKSNYGTIWEDSQLQVRRNIGIAKELFNSAGKEFAQLTQQLGSKIADAVTGGTNFQNDAEFMSKKILDPQAALLFKGVEFREFQFDFQMMARNKSEADEIRRIIKTFKWAMHPGSGASSFSQSGSGSGGAMWTYPHFFEIYLCTPSRNYMFNIMNSALKAMEVDYGGSGVPSFFKANGAPVDIRLSLTFRELFVLTQDMILKDY